MNLQCLIMSAFRKAIKDLFFKDLALYASTENFQMPFLHLMLPS